jgi:hypothetical protein
VSAWFPVPLERRLALERWPVEVFGQGLGIFLGFFASQVSTWSSLQDLSGETIKTIGFWATAGVRTANVRIRNSVWQFGSFVTADRIDHFALNVTG